MGMSEETWYFIYFVEDRIIYTEHEIMNRDKAEKDGRRIMKHGFAREGVHEKVSRVCVISENGDIAIDICNS